MTFINIARARGTDFFLVHHQGSIFRYLRLFGLLLTPLFIPLLVIYEEKDSGYQAPYTWLWYLVGFVCIAIFVGAVARDCWRVRRKRRDDQNKMAELDGCHQRSSQELRSKPLSQWSAEEVGLWIRHCEELKQLSHFTDGELEAIAQKFGDSKVDGLALIEISADAKLLVKYVGLAIGEALHFSSTVEKMRKANLITFDSHKTDVEKEEQYVEG